METGTLYHPTTHPFFGLCSKRSIVALIQGLYAVVKNFRYDEELFRVRHPMTTPGTVTQSPLAASGKWIGKWSGHLNGVATRVAADNNGNVYSLGTGHARTTLTANSGKYGDTRLDSQWLMVSFAPSKDKRTGLEYLVIQDGKGYARVWNPNETDTGERIAINQPIELPNGKSLYPCVATVPKFFTISNHNNTSYSNSNARFAGADTGGASTTANYIEWAIDTTAASGDTSAWTLSAGVDLSGCPKLAVYIEGDYPGLMEQLQLDITDSVAGSNTIWNRAAANTVYKPYDVITIDNDNKKRIYIFSIEHLTAAQRDVVTGVLWTFKGTPPGVNKDIKCYGVFGCGKIQGGSTYTISLLNQGSRAESSGLRYDPDDIVGEYFRNIGCSASLQERLPITSLMTYQYNITFQNTTTAQQTVGVDAAVIYRSDPGEDTYQRSYVATKVLSTYSAGWTFSNDDLGASQSARSLFTYSDNADVGSKDLSIVEPDADCLTIPKGIWMESTSERLFVASYETAGGYGTPSYSALWASDVSNFSRFYRYHRSEEQGTRNEFSGETLICIKIMPTSVYGVSTCLALTNAGLYRFSPTSATAINRMERISPYGTWAPYSVAVGPEAVYWVDQYKIAREYSGGGVRDISSLAIQDKLDGVGGLSWSVGGQSNGKLFFGGFWREKYYLSCDQDGSNSWTANVETPLIYDTRRNAWMEDVLGHAGTSTRFWDPFQDFLFVYSLDGLVYRYEDPDSGQATDGYQYETGGVPVAGTGYTATLKTGAIFLGLENDVNNGIVMKFNDIMCDDYLGAGDHTAAFTYDYFPGRSTPTHSANINQNATVVWATPATVPSEVTEGRGMAVACQVVLSIGCAGVRIYGWRGRFERQPYRPSAE